MRSLFLPSVMRTKIINSSLAPINEPSCYDDDACPCDECNNESCVEVVNIVVLCWGEG